MVKHCPMQSINALEFEMIEYDHDDDRKQKPPNVNSDVYRNNDGRNPFKCNKHKDFAIRRD